MGMRVQSEQAHKPHHHHHEHDKIYLHQFYVSIVLQFTGTAKRIRFQCLQCLCAIESFLDLPLPMKLVLISSFCGH